MLQASCEAAAHSISEGALFLCLTAPGVTLDQVSADAVAALGTVTVPEQLFGLEQRRLSGKFSVQVFTCCITFYSCS